MEVIRDKEGRTEKEFLQGYDATRYPRPSLTADILVFTSKPSLLLVKRGGHPFLGAWALPGGFAEKGESIEETAARELWEETSVRDISLQPVGFYSKPGRDVRGWVVSRSFAVWLTKAPDFHAGDDAKEAAFFDLILNKKEDIYGVMLIKENICLKIQAKVIKTKGEFGISWQYEDLKSQGLAFDHAHMIMDGLVRLEEAGRLVFSKGI